LEKGYLKENQQVNKTTLTGRLRKQKGRLCSKIWARRTRKKRKKGVGGGPFGRKMGGRFKHLV